MLWPVRVAVREMTCGSRGHGAVFTSYMLGSDGHGGGLAARVAWMQPVADVLVASGNAVFSHLALIFAVGVAVGIALVPGALHPVFNWLINDQLGAGS